MESQHGFGESRVPVLAAARIEAAWDAITTHAAGLELCGGRRALKRMLVGRHAQLEETLADWNHRDRAEFAELLERFAADVDRWSRPEFVTLAGTARAT